MSNQTRRKLGSAVLGLAVASFLVAGFGGLTDHQVYEVWIFGIIAVIASSWIGGWAL